MQSLVAFGSSSTRGAGASKPGETGFVALLGHKLRKRFPRLAVINLGRDGACIDELIADWDDVEGARPELLIVLPFTDFAKSPVERFTRDIGLLLAAANMLSKKAESDGRSFQLFVGDLRIDPLYLEGTRKKSDGPCYRLVDYMALLEKNAVVAAAAAENKAVTVVPVVDQNAIHPEWISSDGHPNDLGHAYLAGCFIAAIEGWLNGASSASVDLEGHAE